MENAKHFKSASDDTTEGTTAVVLKPIELVQVNAGGTRVADLEGGVQIDKEEPTSEVHIQH